MNLEDILMSDDVIESIGQNLNDLLAIIPELGFMIGFEHKHPHHFLNVWLHTVYAVGLSKKDFDIRLALLLHDIGKPFSYQEGEIRHFRNHPKVSAGMAMIILNRLNFDYEYIKKICYLIEMHDSEITDEMIIKDYDLCLKLLEIQRCDALAHHPNMLEKREKYLNKINEKILKLKNI